MREAVEGVLPACDPEIVVPLRELFQ